VQVKNGAIDFQPREPFHPLFGAMPKTPLMMEFQITKEYLGFATHLVYLGSLWEEVLRADTHRPRKGTTVADVLDTPVRRGAPTGIAGVANIGTDRNWSGSQFDQANWYAYGRLAWNPDQSAETIAADWSRGRTLALTSRIGTARSRLAPRIVAMSSRPSPSGRCRSSRTRAGVSVASHSRAEARSPQMCSR